MVTSIDQALPSRMPMKVNAVAVTPGVLASRAWRRFREVMRASRVVPAAREIDAERQHLRRMEPGVHREQVVHAPDEQPGADEQQERQRDLRDDERLAKARLLARDRPSGAAQGRGDIHACAANAGHAAGQHRRDNREAAAEQGDAQVRDPTRSPSASPESRSSQQRRRAPAGKQQIRMPCPTRRARGFPPAAAGQAASASPDRKPQRELAVACGAAGDQQVRDVGADDQQHTAATLIRIRSGSVTLCRSPEC